MEISLSNKVAFVTGSARGIGKEIALTLGGAGANISAGDITPEPLRQTCAEIERLGVRTLQNKVNVASFQEVENALKQTFDKFGKIDILVNNAGITRDNIIPRLREEDWDTVLDVNLKGVFNCIKAVSRYMLKQRFGKIISISSVAAVGGNPGQANYASAKAGVIALTKTAAKEFASRGIQVNAVAPGFITTDMTSTIADKQKEIIAQRILLGRFGTPKDIANAVLFLASDLSDYITGQVVIVDGGMML
jgi:3-oxoacyl-[acyl-carrier protein] reductase